MTSGVGEDVDRTKRGLSGSGECYCETSKHCRIAELWQYYIPVKRNLSAYYRPVDKFLLLSDRCLFEIISSSHIPEISSQMVSKARLLQSFDQADCCLGGGGKFKLAVEIPPRTLLHEAFAQT